MRPLLALSALLIPSLAYGQILITEVQPDPRGTDSAGEWIEIHNTSTAAVGLGGWQLHDFSRGQPNRTRFTFPSSATIAVDQVWVIAQTANGFRSLFGLSPTYELRESDPAVDNMIRTGGTSQMALSNRGDAVLLLAPDGTVVDAMEWGAQNSRTIPGNPARSAPSGSSLVRIAREGSSAERFIVVSSPTPFEGFGANLPPTVTGRTTAPLHLRFAEMVTATATVTDPDGNIDTVSVHVATSTAFTGPTTTEYQAFAMTRTSTSSQRYTWSAPTDNLGAGLGFNEPQTFHDRYVRLFVTAVDEGAKTSTSPSGANVAADNTEYTSRNVMPPAPSPISDLRAQDSDAEILYDNHSVTIEGIAMTSLSPLISNRVNMVINDGTGGMFISSSSTNFPAVMRGDVVRVVGYLDQSRGLTRISGTTSLSITKTGATMPVPEPVEVTISELLMDPERYESQLVLLRGVTMAGDATQWRSNGAGGGSNYNVQNSAMTRMAVRIWSGTITLRSSCEAP